jgi:DNA primase catalytic subunit
MQKGVSLLANKGILSDQLATLTEDVRVEIDAYVSGNMLKPQVKLTDIAIAKGGLRESITEKITETVQDKKEEVEQTVRDTIDTIKEDIKASRDSAKQVIVSEIDSSKKQIEGQVNTIIDSLKAGNVDSLSSKINEIFKGQENKIDKIKDKIKIPLFKKKTGN